MVSKLATFREDSDIWDSFQAKAKSKGTNASALLQRFVRDYLDDKIDNRIDSPAAPMPDIEAMIAAALANHTAPALVDTVDIDSKINEAIAAAMAHSAAPDMGAIEAMIDNRIAALKQSINDEFIDMKQAIAAIETTRSEATAPTKKPLMQIARERVTAA
jgi:hypothetical protein